MEAEGIQQRAETVAGRILVSQHVCQLLSSASSPPFFPGLKGFCHLNSDQILLSALPLPPLSIVSLFYLFCCLPILCSPFFRLFLTLCHQPPSPLLQPNSLIFFFFGFPLSLSSPSSSSCCLLHITNTFLVAAVSAKCNSFATKVRARG